MKSLNLDTKTFDPRTVMSMISRAKDKLMTPRQFRADGAGDYFREKVAEVYQLYEKEMKKACALDFDDIIMKTVLLLQSNPDVLEYYQRKVPLCAGGRVSGHQLRPVCADQPAGGLLPRTSALSGTTTNPFTNSGEPPLPIFSNLKSSSRTRKPSVWNRTTVRPAIS